MEIIEIQGYIGNDAITKEKNGVSTTYFSVAVTKKYTDSKGVKTEKTNWYAVYKQPNKLDDHLKKGTAVFVRGNLTVKIGSYQGNATLDYSINNPQIVFSLGNRKKETETTDQEQHNDQHADQHEEKVENNSAYPPSTKVELPPNVNFDGIPPELPDDDLPF
jgi:single-stranded DNA-binding protein